MQGFDLLTKEVASVKRGMSGAGFRRVVAHAMMALGKDRHAVHPSLQKGRGKGFRIELAADVGNVRRRMKIEVNLAEAEI